MTTAPFPDGWSAERTLTRRQQIVAVTVFAALAAGFVVVPQVTGTVLISAFTAAFLTNTGYRIACYWKGYKRLGHRTAAPALDQAELPSYTVLVALYHEANVVPQLFDALERLEYPRDRLEVLVIVESDDDETQAACRAALRDRWRIVVVPPGTPRTKPAAPSPPSPPPCGRSRSWAP